LLKRLKPLNFQLLYFHGNANVEKIDAKKATTAGCPSV